MGDYRNPSIYLNGFRIDEPVTTATDFIIAAVGILAFIGLGGKQSRHIVWFRWFFLVTAISTFVSSLIGHAFNYYFGNEARIYGWMIGIASASTAQFAATYHAQAFLSRNAFRFLLAFNMAETVAACIATMLVRSFVVVEIHSAVALLCVLFSLEWFIYSKTRTLLSRDMMIGVGLCICAVVCHVAKLAISEWFNHLDISHVFMAAALWVMYRGAKTEHIAVPEPSI